MGLLVAITILVFVFSFTFFMFRLLSKQSAENRNVDKNEINITPESDSRNTSKEPEKEHLNLQTISEQPRNEVTDEEANQAFSKEELEKLEDFEKQITANEELQIAELQESCNISFQYAKTYSNYVKDWENTKQKMIDQLNTGNLPPDTSPEFHKKMIEIADRVIEMKLERVRENFQIKFGESIFNYLGSDGKTKGCLGVVLFFLIAGASLLFLL